MKKIKKSARKVARKSLSQLPLKKLKKERSVYLAAEIVRLRKVNAEAKRLLARRSEAVVNAEAKRLLARRSEAVVRLTRTNAAQEREIGRLASTPEPVDTNEAIASAVDTNEAIASAVDTIEESIDDSDAATDLDGPDLDGGRVDTATQPAYCEPDQLS